MKPILKILWSLIRPIKIDSESPPAISLRKIKRQNLKNIAVLQEKYRSMFLAVQNDMEVEPKLHTFYQAIFTVEGLLWTNTGKLNLEWHEFCVKRMLILENQLPDCRDYIRSPKRLLKNALKLLRLIANGIKPIDTDSFLLVFWDSRVFYNKYHWYVDALPRLCSVSKLERYKLVLPDEAMEIQYIAESLNTLGIPTDNVLRLPGRSDQLWMGNRVSVLSPAIMGPGSCNTQLITLLRSHFNIPLLSINKKNKIFIDRKPGSSRCVVNNQELNGLLYEFGFTSILPERLDHTDLLNLMAKSSVIMGVMGAGLTNMLFMPAGSDVVELLPSSCFGDLPDYWRGEYPVQHAGYFYYGLADACGHKYSAVICDPQDLDCYPLDANIYVDCKKLRRTLVYIGLRDD